MYQCFHRSCRRLDTNFAAYEVLAIRRLSDGPNARMPWCDIQVFHVRFHASVMSATPRDDELEGTPKTLDSRDNNQTPSATYLVKAVKTERRELLESSSLAIDALALVVEDVMVHADFTSYSPSKV